MKKGGRSHPTTPPGYAPVYIQQKGMMNTYFKEIFIFDFRVSSYNSDMKFPKQKIKIYNIIFFILNMFTHNIINSFPSKFVPLKSSNTFIGCQFSRGIIHL